MYSKSPSQVTELQCPEAGYLKWNKAFAASPLRDTTPPLWRARDALGREKQRAYMI